MEEESKRERSSRENRMELVRQSEFRRTEDHRRIQMSEPENGKVLGIPGKREGGDI